MELFGVEQKKKIADATEAQQVAVQVSVALIEFIVNYPNSDIEVEPNRNPIALRRRASGGALEITCDGPNTFRVKESMGFQQVVAQPRRSAYDAGVLTLGELDRRVTAWLKK
jgi:hypothetical protein